LLAVDDVTATFIVAGGFKPDLGTGTGFLGTRFSLDIPVVERRPDLGLTPIVGGVVLEKSLLLLGLPVSVLILRCTIEVVVVLSVESPITRSIINILPYNHSKTLHCKSCVNTLSKQTLVQ